MSDAKKSAETRIAELEAWRAKASDALARHEAALKDATKDLTEHASALGDHERQIAKLRLLVANIGDELEKLRAEVAGVQTRLDRHEEYHQDAQRALINIGIALHEAKEERRTSHLELKDLILEKLVPRTSLPTSLEADGLRAKLAGLEQQLAAAERERDDLRALVRDRP